MNASLIILLLVVVAYIVVTKYFSARVASSPEKTKKRYHYQRKQYIMTQNEDGFFTLLLDIIGANYFVFPQIHLSSILDEKGIRQNWKAAFRAINQKSVDYVICDRSDRKTLLAIELDDSSHANGDRQVRDENVERMLKEAGIPLLRFSGYQNLRKDDLRRTIMEIIQP